MGLIFTVQMLCNFFRTMALSYFCTAQHIWWTLTERKLDEFWSLTQSRVVTLGEGWTFWSSTRGIGGPTLEAHNRRIIVSHHLHIHFQILLWRLMMLFLFFLVIKINGRWDYVQVNKKLYKDMNRFVAFYQGLTTWARWVEKNLNPAQTKVFFLGISPVHYQ